MEDWVKPGCSRDPTTCAPELCTWCGKLLVPPVTRCGAGHGVCYACVIKAGSFCDCGSRYACPPARFNRFSKFSCSNRTRGCSQKLPVDVLHDHEATCPYNPNNPVTYGQASRLG